MASIRNCVIRMHPLLEDLIRILECSDSSAALPIREDQLRKSASRSFELLGAGCKEYDLDHFEEAFKLYNRSIATAPPNSKELAMAYNYRSELSLDLECFEFCLLNANRALKGPLPETSGHNAVENKLECWEKLQCKHDSSKGSKEVADSVYEINLCADMPCPESSTCRQMRIDMADITPDNLPPRDPLWDTEFNNPLLPNVSSKVKIEHNLEYGRHLLATEYIEPGEVLWIQDYYSLMAMNEPDEMHFAHCAYCTAWCEALIPCLACTEEMYCSLYCRESAYNVYHRIECKLLTFLPKSLRDSTRVRLALRIFLTGTKQGADLNKLMRDPKVFEILNKGSNCVGVPYVTNDYLAVLNLRWRDVGLYADSCATDEDCRTEASRPMVQKETIPDNDGSTKGRNGHREFENHSICSSDEEHPFPDDMRSTFLAIFSALKRIGFFDEKIHTFGAVDRLTQAELLACALLLQNLLVLKKNYGFIHSFFKQPETTAEQKTGWIQLGSIADLMNHSCDPNTATFQHRGKILTHSLRPIKAGEQLFTHYEYYFCWNPLEQRQEYLKNNYSMVCRCPACVHDWPLEESLRCKSIEFSKPLHEIDREDMREIFEWWKKSDQLEKRKSINVHDLEKALRYSKIIHEYIEQPSIITSVCERYIRQVMARKGGW